MRLRALLNGESVEPPEEWVISRMCEEFDCLPSAAVRELDEGDIDLIRTILEMRSYAHAKGQVDRATKQSDLKMTPAIQRVFEIEKAAIDEERRRAT